MISVDIKNTNMNFINFIFNFIGLVHNIWICIVKKAHLIVVASLSTSVLAPPLVLRVDWSPQIKIWHFVVCFFHSSAFFTGSSTSSCVSYLCCSFLISIHKYFSKSNLYSRSKHADIGKWFSLYSSWVQGCAIAMTVLACIL